MPRAFDRHIPPADKDPTANLLLYGIEDAAATAGGSIKAKVEAPIPQSQIDTDFQNLLDDLDQAATDAWNAAVQSLTDLGATITEMWENWFGTTAPDTTPVQVAQTFEAIRAAVAGGYTLQTFTASNASWTVPPELAAATETYATCVNGGGKGAPGIGGAPDVFVPGGAGGINGGFISLQLDPSEFASTLAITVGAAATVNNTAGGESKIMSGATTLITGTANVGGISTVNGYLLTTSVPGSGGDGGDIASGDPSSASDSAHPGGSSAVATGGARGTPANASVTNVTGGAGGGGENGTYTDIPLCGGAGGGGGGSAWTAGFATATGGAGGTGGFPGGGSGGGGSAVGFGDVPGASGTPANGLVALLWK